MMKNNGAGWDIDNIDEGFTFADKLSLKIIKLEHQIATIKTTPPTDVTRKLVYGLEQEIIELKLKKLDL